MKPLTPEQQKLVEKNHDLIYFVLNRKKWSVDKHYGAAAEGLCKAAATYDEEKGAFSTYATAVITNEILMEIRHDKAQKRDAQSDLSTNTRLKTATSWEWENFPVYLGDTLYADESTSPEYCLALKEAIAAIRKLPRKYVVVMGLVQKGYTQQEIAQKTGLSQATISRMIERVKELVLDFI